MSKGRRWTYRIAMTVLLLSSIVTIAGLLIPTRAGPVGVFVALDRTTDTTTPAPGTSSVSTTHTSTSSTTPGSTTSAASSTATWTGGNIHVADVSQHWDIHFSDGSIQTLDTSANSLTQSIPPFGGSIIVVQPTYVRVSLQVNFVSKVPLAGSTYAGATIYQIPYVYFQGIPSTPSGYQGRTIIYTSYNNTGKIEAAAFYILLNVTSAPTDPTASLAPINLVGKVNAFTGLSYDLQVITEQDWTWNKYCNGVACGGEGSNQVLISADRQLPTFAAQQTQTITTVIVSTSSSVLVTKTATSTVTTSTRTSATTIAATQTHTVAATTILATQTINGQPVTVSLVQSATAITNTFSLSLGAIGNVLSNVLVQIGILIVLAIISVAGLVISLIRKK